MARQRKTHPPAPVPEPSPEPEPEPIGDGEVPPTPKPKREVKRLTDQQKDDLRQHMDKVGKDMSVSERKSHRMKMMAKMRSGASVKEAHKAISA